jgi:hypothetical protein
MKTDQAAFFRTEVGASSGLGCPSFGGQRTLDASSTANAALGLLHRPGRRSAAPFRSFARSRNVGFVAQEACSALGMPNPAFERTAPGVPGSAAQGSR